jgi:adenylosuccinate synthase
MPVSVVVGGQFGSEGKGKVAHYFAKEQNAKMVVRVGGSNSGHTVIDPDSGRPLIFRHLPTACILPDPICVIPAGAYIDADVLLEEIRRVNLPDHRLIIDPKAVLITEADKESERKSGLGDDIGSTMTGTGAAVIKRIKRLADTAFVSDHSDLRQYVRETVPRMRKELEQKQRVIIEGTQGFGLSLLHSPHYPFTTSRDTTASGFISEVGLSPLDVDNIIMVLRSFPIRVSGKSGPLTNETDWKTVTNISGKQTKIKEYTSVTKQERPKAFIKEEIDLKAIQQNAPNIIVMNHLDYIGDCLSINKFITKVEFGINKLIDKQSPM